MNTIRTIAACDKHPHAAARFLGDVATGKTLMCADCQSRAAADPDNAGVEYLLLPGTSVRYLPDGLYVVEPSRGIAGGKFVVVAGRAMTYDERCECCGAPTPACDCIGPAVIEPSDES